MKHILLSVTILTLLTAGCGRGTERHGHSHNGTELITTARNLSITEDDGYTQVRIRNPWDTTRTLSSYILVDRDSVVPAGVDTVRNTLIRTPLRNSLVFSNVYVSLIKELGALESVGGICDAEYITDKTAAARIAAGTIRNCGQMMNPNIEMIMTMRPDGILLSPMNGNDSHGKLSSLGIPLIEAADYMENTPLGRAEWMRFYGRLYGQDEKADSLFETVRREYNDIRDKAHKATKRPKVLIDGVYGNVWNVPTDESVTGNIINDAMGFNPFGHYDMAGCAQLTPEKVLYEAADADIWFYRYFKPNDITLAQFAAENPNYNRIKAYKDGNVYGTNTRYSGVFDDAAFHPHWVLAEMVSILHPEITDIPQTRRYYKKLK